MRKKSWLSKNIALLFTSINRRLNKKDKGISKKCLIHRGSLKNSPLNIVDQNDLL